MMLSTACTFWALFSVLYVMAATVQGCSFPATPNYPTSFPHTPQDLDALVSSVGRDMSNSVACAKFPVSNQSDLHSALEKYWTALEKYIVIQDHMIMDASSTTADDYHYIKPVSLTWDLVLEGNCSSPVPDDLPNIHHQTGDDWSFECPSCCILAGDPVARRRFFLFKSSGHESLTLRNLAFFRGGLDPAELLNTDVAIAAKKDISMGGCAYFSMVRNLKVENVYFQDCVANGGGGVGVLASEFLNDPDYLLKIAHVWRNVVITNSRVTGSGGGILYKLDAYVVVDFLESKLQRIARRDGALVFQNFHVEDSFAGYSKRFESNFSSGLYDTCNATIYAIGTGGGMSVQSLIKSPKGNQKRVKVSVLNSTFRRNFALVELGENDCGVQAVPENSHGGALEVSGPVQLDFANSLVADCQASVEGGALAVTTMFWGTLVPSMNIIRSSHFENDSAITSFGSVKSADYNGLQMPVTWAGGVMIEVPGFCGIPHPGMNVHICSESIMAAPHLFIGDGLVFKDNSVAVATEHYSWDSAHLYDQTDDLLIMPGAHLAICPSAFTTDNNDIVHTYDGAEPSGDSIAAVPWMWNVNSSVISSSLSDAACSIESFVNAVEEIFAKQNNASTPLKSNTSDKEKITSLPYSEKDSDNNDGKDRKDAPKAVLIFSVAGGLAAAVVIALAAWKGRAFNYFIPRKTEYGVLPDLSVDEWSYDQSSIGLEKGLKGCASSGPYRSQHSDISRASEDSGHAGRDVVLSVINHVCTSDMQVLWSNVIDKIMARVGKLKIVPTKDLIHRRNLSSGAFKEVSICSWEGFDVAVAIMKTEAAFDIRNLEDLVQEITLLLFHQHPCMVRLFGVTEDRPGLVMEHVKTGSLFTYRRERDPMFFTPQIMTLIALQIAKGVKFLHSNGIIHFDIKCQNVLIDEESNGLPICKIADLGMARKKHDATTAITVGPRGTVFWMAPELYEHNDTSATEKVDVFSFGITMWELWTGRLPYEGLSDFSVMKGVKEGSLRPDIPSDCNPKWAALMKACWDLDPSKRPGFNEINALLEELLQELS